MGHRLLRRHSTKPSEKCTGAGGVRKCWASQESQPIVINCLVCVVDESPEGERHPWLPKPDLRKVALMMIIILPAHPCARGNDHNIQVLFVGKEAVIFWVKLPVKVAVGWEPCRGPLGTAPPGPPAGNSSE